MKLNWRRLVLEATSLELHHLEYASRAQLGIIGADSPPDIQSENCPNYGLQCQVIGRLWRLGQKEKVYWKILQTQSTFDPWLETKHMRAYVSTVEAGAAIDARITTSRPYHHEKCSAVNTSENAVLRQDGPWAFQRRPSAGANEESDKALGDSQLSDDSCTQGDCEFCELADEYITTIDSDLYMTLHSVNQSIGRREKVQMVKEAIAENQSRAHFLKYEMEYLERNQSEIECRESDCKAVQEFIEYMEDH